MRVTSEVRRQDVLNPDAQTQEKAEVWFRIEKGPRYALMFVGNQSFTAGYLRENVLSFEQIEACPKASCWSCATKPWAFTENKAFGRLPLHCKIFRPWGIGKNGPIAC